MSHLVPTSGVARRAMLTFAILGLFGSLALSGTSAGAAPPMKKPVPPAANTPDKPAPPPAPRSSILTSEAWEKVPLAAAKSDDIDNLVARELEVSKITPAPLTTDEQFLRRVTLDLTGQLPQPA